MTKEEILARISVIEREVVNLQLKLRDLHLQIREGVDTRRAPRYNEPQA